MQGTDWYFTTTTSTETILNLSLYAVVAIGLLYKSWKRKEEN